MSSSEVESEALLSESPSLVGKTLSGRYRIERFLDEGGMGAVYLAEHLLMHKRFAVKVLHPEMTRSREVVSRFEREAVAAAHIEHPNVAAATDFGQCEDGSFFLVLEYVEGIPLSSVIAQRQLDVGRVLHIAHQIASALASAHAIGIVHRDLKPDNVMLVDRNGDPDFVKVLDFGIAKVPVLDLFTTQAGKVFGTPAYMAPEQALGLAVDARADLYALGVVLFEMLMGVHPFELEGERVSAPVEALVMRLLERDPDDRFQSAHEVLDAIEASGSWISRTRTPTRPATPIPWRIRARLRRMLPTELLAGAATGLLLFFVGAALLRSPERAAPAEAIVAPAASLEPAPTPRFESLAPSSPDNESASEPRKPVNAAKGRVAPSKSPVRQKRSNGLTDFGGRR